MSHIVGKNGAGKTTTMKMILGFLKPDKGQIKVCGEKVTYDTTCTLTGATPANVLYPLTNTAISRSFKVL